MEQEPDMRHIRRVRRPVGSSEMEQKSKHRRLQDSFVICSMAKYRRWEELAFSSPMVIFDSDPLLTLEMVQEAVCLDHWPC